MDASSRKRTLLGAAGLAVFCGAIVAWAATEAKPGVSLRKTESQVVLYTIHRGAYDKLGEAIGPLYGLAGANGLQPQGAITCAYLNNPSIVTSEHYLTEVRLPVGPEALKLAGTLGKYTDVKRLPPMEWAVLPKPKGVGGGDGDAIGALYRQLQTWISANGYEALEGPCEAFPADGGAASYADMKTNLMIPVRKISAASAK